MCITIYYYKNTLLKFLLRVKRSKFNQRIRLLNITIPHFRLFENSLSLNRLLCLLCYVNLLIKFNKTINLLRPRSFCFNLAWHRRGRKAFHRNFHRDSKDSKEEEEEIIFNKIWTQNTRVLRKYFFSLLNRSSLWAWSSVAP